jgi:hypothetical protein
MDPRLFLAGMALCGEMVRNVNAEGQTIAWNPNEAPQVAERCVAFADAVIARLAIDKDQKPAGKA